MANMEKRGKDSWRFTVNLGNDAEGKPILRRKTVKGIRTKSEARSELSKFETEVLSGEYIAPEKMTISAFVQEWKNKYAKKQLGAKTYETYLLHLNNRILPAFGHLRLDQIKPVHIINFLDNLSETGIRKDKKEGGLSSGTIEYHHRILRNIFKRAVEWKMIKCSPAQSVKKPKVTQKKTLVYDENEVSVLLDKLSEEDIKWQALITLALTCGLRRGELLGLEWKHINFEEDTIEIKQTLTYTKENGYDVKEPKTKNSKRKVSMPLSVTILLKALKKKKLEERMKAEELWEGGDYLFVFSSWNGKPMHPSSVKTWWKRFTTKHSLPYIRFHDLRHTSATLLLNKGVHMKIISARLGHANILTTMNIYGHALESADREAANQLNNLFEANLKVKGHI
jgi:integrase